MVECRFDCPYLQYSKDGWCPAAACGISSGNDAIDFCRQVQENRKSVADMGSLYSAVAAPNFDNDAFSDISFTGRRTIKPWTEDLNDWESDDFIR